MTAPKFMSGPWSVDDEGDVLSSRPGVAICSPFPCDTDSPHQYGYGETTATNARLIAAAPELYQSLLEMVEDSDDVDDGELPKISAAALTRARQALAKATQP